MGLLATTLTTLRSIRTLPPSTWKERPQTAIQQFMLILRMQLLLLLMTFDMQFRSKDYLKGTHVEALVILKLLGLISELFVELNIEASVPIPSTGAFVPKGRDTVDEDFCG